MQYMNKVSFVQVHQYREATPFLEEVLSSWITLDGFHGRCLFLSDEVMLARFLRVPLSITPCAPIVSSSLMQRYGFRHSASHMFKRIAACKRCNVLSDFVSLAISSNVIAFGTE